MRLLPANFFTPEGNFYLCTHQYKSCGEAGPYDHLLVGIDLVLKPGAECKEHHGKVLKIALSPIIPNHPHSITVSARARKTIYDKTTTT